MAAFTTTRAYSYDYVNGELLEQDDGLDSFVQKQMTDGMDTIFYTSGNYKFIAALDKENNLYLGCDEGIYSYKAVSYTHLPGTCHNPPHSVSGPGYPCGKSG